MRNSWQACLVAVTGLVLLQQFALQAAMVEITPQQRSRHGTRYNNSLASRFGSTGDFGSRYNLRLGDLQLALTGRLAAQWSDNVNYSDEDGNSIDSWSIVPELSLSAYWLVTPQITLSSGVSAGYRYYTDSEANSDFFLSSDAGGVAASLGGQIRLADDLVLSIHDRLSHDTETLEIVARDTAGDDYGSWSNVIDASVSKRLNRDADVTLTLAHENRFVDGSDYDYQNYAKDSVDATLLYRVLKSLRVGPYIRFETTRFSEGMRNDHDSLEAGLSSVGSLHEGSIVQFTANIGYETLFLDDANDPAATDDDDGLTGNLQIAVTPKLFPGHRIRTSYRRNYEDPEPGINYADELLLGYGVDYRFTETIVVSADVDWMDISESDNGENAQIWRFYLRTGWQLREDTSVSASYRHTTKSSDAAGLEYDENTIELAVTYRF